MGRSAFGRRLTCESCLSIDVRQWHRHASLRHTGLRFTWSWNRRGTPLGAIDVRIEADAVVLTIKGDSEWRSVEQRYRSCGRSATSAGYVLGFVAARLSVADSAGDVWRSYTCATPRYSDADIAAAWLTEASRRSRAIAPSAERRSLGCSSALDRASSIPSLASHQECIGEPSISYSTGPRRRRSVP